VGAKVCRTRCKINEGGVNNESNESNESNEIMKGMKIKEITIFMG
jgi:hypothetical protein